MTQPFQIVPSSGPRVPMFWWPLLVAVLIGAGAFLWGVFVGQEKVLVAKADIPAGTRVTAAQFEERDRWIRGLPDGVLRPPASRVDGRVSREALASGAPVAGDALTEPVAALGTILHLKPARVSAAGVAIGDRIRLRFAPTGDRDVTALSVPGVLLQAPTDKATDLVVSVDRSYVDAVLGVAGRADVIVTPG
jgi:hypothetical protein